MSVQYNHTFMPRLLSLQTALVSVTVCAAVRMQLYCTYGTPLLYCMCGAGEVAHTALDRPCLWPCAVSGTFVCVITVCAAGNESVKWRETAYCAEKDQVLQHCLDT